MKLLPSLRIGAVSVLVPLIATCGEVGDARSNVMLRDSAGIRIAENPSLDGGSRFSLAGPDLVIGQIAGAPEYELHDVNGVVRLSDGSVVVATGGNQIRWYDAQGRFRLQSGRDGDGPGEFRRIRYMRVLSGDSLLVFDSGNRRVSVFAPDGAHARSETIRTGDDRPLTIAAALGDGTLLLRTVLETPGTSTRLYRMMMGFTVVRGDAEFYLPSYPGPEASLHAAETGGDIASAFISILPFARSAYATAGATEFFVGSSDAYQIDVWNEAGRLIRIIRAAVPATRVTDDVRQDYISRELQRMRVTAEESGRIFDEADARRRLNDQAHAPAVPAYAGLLGTAEGGLWVKAFQLPEAGLVREQWTIFDVEGRRAGAIRLPPGFTPFYVHGRSVLGVVRDSLDVPYVHSYTLNRAM